jgi:hypothetical protein
VSDHVLGWMCKELFNSQHGQEVFPFSKASRLVIQPPVQWALGAVSSEVKQLGLEADCSPPSSVEELYLHSSVLFMACTGKTLPSLL